MLGKDLIAWFQDMHSYEDHSSSVSGIPCESLSDQIPQTHWWENLFSVFYPITGFPSTLPLSKEHGFYGKTEGAIGEAALMAGAFRDCSCGCNVPSSWMVTHN